MLFFYKLMLSFDRFEQLSDGGYWKLSRILRNLGRFLYHNIFLIAVYCSGIAVLLAATCLILNARNRIKLGEAKEKVVRVMIVSILIFGTTGLVQLVRDIAIKGF